MLEDKPSGQRDRILPPVVAETASKPSAAPLQKHSLDGCSIDRAASYRFAERYFVDMQYGRGALIFMCVSTQKTVSLVTLQATVVNSFRLNSA